MKQKIIEFVTRPGVAKDFLGSTMDDNMGGKEDKCGDSIDFLNRILSEPKESEKFKLVLMDLFQTLQ